MLPAVLPRPAGLDIGARSIPAKAVGGDFFDVFALGAGRLGFAIGDVAGKGIPRRSSRPSHAHCCASRPCELPRRARAVERKPAFTGKEQQGLFVTLLYGVLDEATRRVTYVRAATNSRCCTTGGALAATPEGRSLPLGLFSELVLEKRTVALHPGDTLLLYTDG